MNYEISLSELQKKLSEFEQLQSQVESITPDGIERVSGTEIAGLSSQVTELIDKLKNGYKVCYSWLNEYLTGIESLENSLANFSCNNIDAPRNFEVGFNDIFSKKVVPTLKSDGDKKTNLDLGEIKNLPTNDFRVVNGNIIDTSKPIGKGEKYNLSKEDISLLAYVAMREQGSVEGAKLELSLMCNLYERNKNNYKSVTDYVLNSGWFANNSLNGYNYPGDEYYQAAEEVINEGNRYLASNVVEHDCLSDLTSCSTGGIYDTSSYVPGETVLHNCYGARYVFIGFAPNGGDPFGYVEKT